MDTMQNMGEGSKNMCKCPHHKAMPIMIIVFGVVFLLGNMGWISWEAVGWIWPILVIIVGIKKLAMKSGMCKCC